MTMRTLVIALTMLLTALGAVDARAESGYDAALQSWKDYRDVARWFDDNFTYDHNRLSQMLRQRNAGGAAALRTREPSKTFEIKSGYCTDAAGFAISALNRINPEYKAGYVFIRNGAGNVHHWVAGFHADGKIYVMDYGQGADWRMMRGVHGPYESLSEYQSFLAGLNVRNFSPVEVGWKEFPGQVD